MMDIEDIQRQDNGCQRKWILLCWKEETLKKDDSLTAYREKEAMTPAQIKEHEPSAVKRQMIEKIDEQDKKCEF